MPRSPLPGTQRGKDLVCSLVGSIEKANTTVLHGRRGRSPYGRVAMEDHDNDEDDKNTNGTVEADEQGQHGIARTPRHDPEDYRNFCIDECDDIDYGIDASDDNDEMLRPALQAPFPSDDGCDCFARHCIHYHPQSPTPPQNYICPLTLQIMEDPVRDRCGHVFERRAILEWLETTSASNDGQPAICPISRKPMIQAHAYSSSSSSSSSSHNIQIGGAMGDSGHQKWDHVLRSDPRLQQRIIEWKLKYPLYQGMDLNYVKHQRAKILSHCQYDRDCESQFHEESVGGHSQASGHTGTSASNSNSNSTNSLENLSRFELMFLPQERRVMKAVKAKAASRRLQRERSRRLHYCLLASVVTGIVLVVAWYVVVVQERNDGPGTD